MGDVLYVYYKVDPALHDELAPRVRAVQAQLAAQWPGLVGGLLQRPEISQGFETWMETYQHSRGVDDALAAAIQQAASTSGLPAPRHSERFIPLR